SQAARPFVTLDEQDGFPNCRRGRPGLFLRGNCRRRGHREKEPKFGAGSNFGAELDPSQMLLNSPIHTRQTEAGAFTELSYRTEGFEQMGLDLRGDAAASVGNGKADELSRSSK